MIRLDRRPELLKLSGLASGADEAPWDLSRGKSREWALRNPNVSGRRELVGALQECDAVSQAAQCVGLRIYRGPPCLPTAAAFAA